LVSWCADAHPGGRLEYRGLAHAVVVTSPQARYLTVHTPAGFEKFVIEVGEPAMSFDVAPDEAPPDPSELAAIAAGHGIEILGPPLVP
jgi:hypothetical protein